MCLMTDCCELSLKRGFKLITLNIFFANDNIGLNFFEKIFVFGKINRLWLTKTSIVNHRGEAWLMMLQPGTLRYLQFIQNCGLVNTRSPFCFWSLFCLSQTVLL